MLNEHVIIKLEGTTRHLGSTVPESGVQPCKYGEKLVSCSKRPESMMGCSQGLDVIAYICETVGIHTLIFITEIFLCVSVKGDQQEYPEEHRQCFKQRTLSSSIFHYNRLTFQMWYFLLLVI